MADSNIFSLMMAQFRGYCAGFYFQDVLEVVELRCALLKKTKIEGTNFLVSHLSYKEELLPVLGLDFFTGGQGSEPYYYGLVLRNRQERAFVVIGIGNDLELRHIPRENVKLLPDYMMSRQKIPVAWGVGIVDKTNVVLTDFGGIDLIPAVAKLLRERR